MEAKLYIGDYAVYDLSLTSHADGPAKAELNYLHRDRLGSVVAMSNSQGAVINMSGRGFDAFGKPREEGWQDSDHSNGINEPGDLNRNDLSTRGFTGHEHLNETDLIHMNGRVYDYNLGRFLSVDPFIQFPANSQSMNAYSYIMNNPLSGTDPSGYAVNSAAQECAASRSQNGCGVGVSQNASIANSLLGQVNRGGTLELAANTGSANQLVSSGNSTSLTTNMAGGRDSSPEAAGSPGQTPVIPNAERESGENSGFSRENTEASLQRQGVPPVLDSKNSSQRGLFKGNESDAENIAAFELGDLANVRSSSRHAEYGAVGYADANGNIQTTDLVKGRSGQVTETDLRGDVTSIRSQAGNIVTFVFHNHGNDSGNINGFEGFSGYEDFRANGPSSPTLTGDINFLINSRLIGYPVTGFLATPRGALLRFDPVLNSSGQAIGGTVTRIGNVRPVKLR